MKRVRVSVIVFVAGCGPQVGTGDEETTSGADDTGGFPGSASVSVSATDPTGDPTSASAPGTSVDSGPNSEVTTDVPLDEVSSALGECMADLGFAGSIECDPFAEDCPCDEKCMPWANDGGSAWNALMCTPVAPDPKQVGEPCTVEGNGVSGIDDCDIHSMCWNVDPETNMGECVAFCTGSAKEPACERECANCAIANDGVLALCFPTCDPLAMDCGEGQTCLPLFGDDFMCSLDLSGDGGAAGDPCEYFNGCDPGLVCLDASYLPSCESAGCCTPFCDVTDPDACTAGPPSESCHLWTEVTEGDEPSACDNPNLGACVFLFG
jgi:hypothetical protein